MFLPKSKYTVICLKPGEFTLSGSPYFGPAMKTYLGEYYAGTDIMSDNRGKLESVYSLMEEHKRVVPIKFNPTEEDYTSGSVVRCFRQSNQTGKIEEISLADLEVTSSEYRYATIKWRLTGQLENSEKNITPSIKVVVPGILSENTEAINSINKELPGIKEILLKNPGEKVRSNTKN